MKFYTPSGQSIDSIEAFIELYREIYHYLNRDWKLEEGIDELRSALVHDPTGFRRTLDGQKINTILRWKTGGKQEASNITPPRSASSINGRAVYQYINDNLKEVDSDAEGFVKGLTEISEIGPVYALAILYFCSPEYPIYDRFAHLALIAILEERVPLQVISDKELRAQFNPDRMFWFDDYESKYASCLRSNSELWSRYQRNRDLDKALWVYGHLFSENKTNNIGL